MPSSPSYNRDYQQERLSETPRRKSDRAKRNVAHRAFEKASGPVTKGTDIDHKRELSKGGSNKVSNLQAMPASKNRSYPRTSGGKMR